MLRFIYIIIYILLFPYYVLGASNVVSFRNISKKNGLPDLTVSSLYKDSQGYMWIGTATSLERYDGMFFNHYTVPGNDDKLKWVNEICESPWGSILMGNEQGLYELREDSLIRLYTDSINGIVRKIIPHKSGKVYVGSKSGIWSFTKEGLVDHIIMNNNRLLFSENKVISFCFDDKDNIWILTTDLLFKYDVQTRKLSRYSDPEKGSSTPYREILFLSGRLYLATMGDGIHTFDVSDNTFGRFIDIGCNVVNDISSDGDDILHIATDGNGIVFASVSRNEITDIFRNDIQSADSLHSNSTYSVLLDRDGILWVGLYQFGLDVSDYNAGLFSIYKSNSGFSTKNLPVRTICIEDNEKVIGTRNGFYFIDELNDKVVHIQVPQIRSNTILCSKKIGNLYYFGTYGGGVYSFDPSTCKVSDLAWEKASDFRNYSVFDITEDKDSNVWLSTSSGLYCYNNEKLIYSFSGKNTKLISLVVYFIFFDSSGKGWISTDKGLMQWSPSSKAILNDVFPEGFINNQKIKSIFEDSSNNLYFVPYNGDMFISDIGMNNYGYLAPSSLMSGKELSFVIEDSDSWLWIGTNDGLFRYDKKNIFLPYGVSDGIPSANFLSCKPVLDSDKNLWFGNSSGLIYCEKGDFNENADSYRLSISKVFLGYEDVTSSLKINVHKDKYSFSIDAAGKSVKLHFTDFSYINTDQRFYEYRINGGDWISFQGAPVVTFSRLIPGTQDIEIRKFDVPSSCITVHIAVPVPNVIYWAILLVVLVFVVRYVLKKRKTEKTIEDKVESINYSRLSDEECRAIHEKLNSVMEEKKLYTNHDLKLNDLSIATGVSMYNLSYVLNHHMNSNFYDYINHYRIKEFERLIKNGEHTKYTMNAVIEKCGFSSRSSFFRYFRKITGMSPSEYLKKNTDYDID